MLDVPLAVPPNMDSPIPEGLMIQRILEGQTELYGVLAARYDRRVYRFVRKMVRSDMDAEDIVQETHLRALTHLHQFRGGCQFITWLSHVAVNLAYRQMRREYRVKRVFDDLQPDTRWCSIPFSSPAPDPESCVLKTESRDELQKALTKLPRRYQTVFIMKEIQHLPTPEIARCLRIRHEHVRLLLHRARRMLRRLIDNEDL